MGLIVFPDRSATVNKETCLSGFKQILFRLLVTSSYLGTYENTHLNCVQEAKASFCLLLFIFKKPSKVYMI